MRSLTRVREDVIRCTRCSRLRTYCEDIAREKRAAFKSDTYWAKPVPGFGDPRAKIVFIGLAPAAHGANRTGRMFTGDGAGGSSDSLMRALHASGLANQPSSTGRDDGLALTGAWITAAVRCAPPANKPAPDEIANCHGHLVDELAALPNARVCVALGRLAFEACLRLLDGWGERPAPKPAFGHGAVCRGAGRAIVASYHPSRQNTHTGRLTQAMLQRVCHQAIALAETTRREGDARHG